MLYYQLDHSDWVLTYLNRIGLLRFAYPMATKSQKSVLLISRPTWRLLKESLQNEQEKSRLYFAVRRKRIRRSALAYLRSLITITDECWAEEIPPEPVVRELILFLKSRPDPPCIKYLARMTSSEGQQQFKQDLGNGIPFVFDLPGGNRNYSWVMLPNHLEAEQLRPENLQHFLEWFRDPEARVVLALSSGGVRCQGLAPALELLESLGLRDYIDEVWGTSGGAITGQLYASGVPPQRIERLGYDLFRRRYPQLPFFESSFHLIGALIRGFWDMLKSRSRSGLIAMHEPLTRSLKDAKSWVSPKVAQIPFYGVATDLVRRGPVALTDTPKVPIHLRTIVYPSAPWISCVPSSLIPIVFPPIDLTVQSTQLLLCDGAVSEEVPLMMPFLKWYRDGHALPADTPQKLKIFYLDFTSYFKRHLHPSPGKKVKLSLRYVAAELLEILLSRPKYNFLSVADEMPNVDVMGIRFDVEGLGFLTTSQIPAIMSRARRELGQQMAEMEAKLAVSGDPTSNSKSNRKSS